MKNKELMEEAMSRVGWFEFVSPDSGATTHVAHAGESGGIYLPEDGVSLESFQLASATERCWKLGRVEALANALEAAEAERDAALAMLEQVRMKAVALMRL